MILISGCQTGPRIQTLQSPGHDQYCQMQPNGISVIPSGRWIRPAGEVTRITHDPYGLALSPDGSLALAVHDNVLTVLHDGQDPIRCPSYDGQIPNPF